MPTESRRSPLERNKLNVAVHDRRHRNRAAGGQDMLEIDAFFFEITFTLGDPDGREVQTGGGGRQSYFDRQLRLGVDRSLTAA
jgi:hypothetical protein